jgi:flagellar protein FliT
MQSALLDHYRGLEILSCRMLSAAEDENWDEVHRLEDLSRSRIEALKVAAQEIRLSRQEWEEKMRILGRIVKIDAQIRNLAQPWLARVEQWLQGRCTDSSPTLASPQLHPSAGLN